MNSCLSPSCSLCHAAERVYFADMKRSPCLCSVYPAEMSQNIVRLWAFLSKTWVLLCVHYTWQNETVFESQPKQLKKAKWLLCLLYFHMLKPREACGKSCSCTHTKHTLYSTVSQHEVLFTALYFYNVHHYTSNRNSCWC